MAETAKPLLIKRYASRRLYNTETSDYVTLEDIASFIRAGREVQIVDLKSGDDLTRQYLLQIVAEHESKGENVLPVDVLTDLVRSYATGMQSVMPQFLAQSFEMLRNAAHTLKSSSANLGAMALSNAAKKVELGARTQTLERPAVAVALIANEFARARQALRASMAKSASQAG
jgi:polyhydroxyalkanoate synthesis repressor PhaR